MTPGPKNLITDVAGIKIGNAEDHDVRSGVTVILPDEPALAAVDVRGGGPGTRETDALDPACLVDAIHAIVLSGGSAYGLDAASGLMGWLRVQGRGFQVADAIIPIVPSAILFDLTNGGDKNWGATPPYRELAVTAAEAASRTFALGNAGAGLGATAGPLKGGLGSASLVNADGAMVGAIVAANPFGSVTMPESGRFWAAAYEQSQEFGGRQPKEPAAPLDLDYDFALPTLGTNTTLAVVATDATLTKAQAQRVAIMAHDGFARAIRPVHTPLDGDTVFVLSTQKRPITDPVGEVAQLGMMAADCVARAVTRGVFEAETLGDFTSYRDTYF